MPVAFLDSISAQAEPASITFLVPLLDVPRSDPAVARHLIVAVQSKVPGTDPANVLSMVDDAPTDPFYGSMYTAGANLYAKVLAGTPKFDAGDVAQGFLSYVSGGPHQMLVVANDIGAANNIVVATSQVGDISASFSPVYTPGVSITLAVATDALGNSTTSWQDMVDWINGNTPFFAVKLGLQFTPTGNDTVTLAGGTDPLFVGRVRTELWAACLLHPINATRTLTVLFDTPVEWAQVWVGAYTGINVDVNVEAGLVASGLARAFVGSTGYDGVVWEHIVL